MILGAIVTYNPDIERLMENIASVINQVDKLLIFDNHSRNVLEIETKLGMNILIYKSDQNIGMSGALNYILNYASMNNYEWFLTLDQDSIIVKNCINQYCEFIKKNNEYNNLAILTCKIKDRNHSHQDIMCKGFLEVNECITSGAFYKTSILKSVGGFDNQLFIDLVDNDICYNLINNGYKIVKLNYEGLLHEIGVSTDKKILTRKIMVANEKVFRLYYMSRNSIYEFRKYKKFKFLKLYFINLGKAILFESNKLLRIKACILGVKDAFSNHMGKSERKWN